MPEVTDSGEDHGDAFVVGGLDDIGVTLESAAAIRSFEQDWRQRSPWLFDVIGQEHR